VLLLLLSWRLFRPVENPPPLAQATTEPAETSAPTTAPPESGGGSGIVAPTLNLPGGEVTPGEVALTGAGEPGSQIQVVVDGKPAGTARRAATVYGVCQSN
jgi:hypothetical protein